MNSDQAETRTSRHCMVVHAYFPMGETRVQREAEALIGGGYSVDVICLRYKREPYRSQAKGINVLRVPLARHRNAGFAVQLIEYIAFFLAATVLVSLRHLSHPYHSIQAHNPPDFLVFCAIIPKLLGARIILDIHDLMPEFFMYRRSAAHEASLDVRLVLLQERLACGFADRVITVSHIWRETLANRGVPPGKIGVVMNLADDRIFARVGKPDDPPAHSCGLRLIYHGMIVERYGLDLVLTALRGLREKAPGIHFTVLGNGPYLANLQAIAEEQQVDDCVTFLTTFRPVEELPAIILGHDVGVVPYRNDRFTDQLVPTKLLEYAALGMPCIVARTTAIQYYFDDEMVEFFSPGSVQALEGAIRHLYESKERRAQLSRGIYDFHTRHTWSEHAREYIQMIRGQK